MATSKDGVKTYFVTIPAHKFLHIENRESNGYWDFWQKQALIPGQDCETICGLLESIRGKLDDDGGEYAGQVMGYLNDATGRLCDWGYLRTECYGARLPADYRGEVPAQMLLTDIPEGEYLVFEHGPFDYEQECRTVEEKVEAAIKLLLEGIGEDPTREGLLETPARVARMYGEIAGGMDQSAEEHLSKTFAVASNDLVIERDITFYSLCEHHLLPFYGKAAIGYIPNGRVAGLSKLARTVEVYARRLQLQEQLCAQVADALMDYLAPQGAIVLMEAEHMCMTMRGVQKPGTKTVTLARRGVFETDPALEERFFRMLGR